MVNQPNRTRRRADRGVIALLMALDLVMLAFAVISARLGEATLAVIAGSGFVALSNQIARALLSRRNNGRRA